MKPMTESSELIFAPTGNEKALSTLSRAIRFSEGQFSLILARCNYLSLQETIWREQKLVSKLTIKEVFLPACVTTLFTTIYGEVTQGEEISALVVFGLESLQALEQVLEATNQVREEFRKNLPFPLVLWVNDEVLQKLARFAPDFKSWASASIKFELEAEELLVLWEKAANSVFDKLLAEGAAGFIDNALLDLAPGCRLRRELEYARFDLQELGVSLTPASEATWQFILGRDAYKNNQVDRALEQYQQCVDFWQQEQQSERRQLTTEKIGILLFHIALCYTRRATRETERLPGSWTQARLCFRDARNIFNEQNRPSWVAQLTIHLGFVLEQLQNWDELQSLAFEFVKEPTNSNSKLELAQAYGFLAQAALAKKSWSQAKLLAQMALKMCEKPAIFSNQQAQASYLMLLAQAQYQLQEHDEAIANLEQARELALHYADWAAQETQQLSLYQPAQIYLQILEELRLLYFQQRQYQLAFELKQEQLSVEQDCGLRAFLGASPLPSPRQSADKPPLHTQINSSPAAAIAASGRQQDIQRLLERLSRSEHKLTIIHGSSGVGKSSLLRAGLVPALKRQIIAAREVVPVLLRIHRDWPQELHKSLTKTLSEMGKLDQEQRQQWQTQSVLEKLRSLSERNLLTVIIFDQFEEFFFICTEERERYQFYLFLRQCLSLPFLKVILSLREEYIYHLLQWEKYGTLETVNNNILDRQVRYSLGDLTTEEATRVVKSLALQSHFPLEDSLINALVLDLAKKRGSVRPIELQVVGAQLQAEGITTLEQYQQLGNSPENRQLGDDPKTILVARSLQTVIADCGQENEAAVWQVLFLLTNDKGTRPLRTAAELIIGLSRLGLRVVEPSISGWVQLPWLKKPWLERPAASSSSLESIPQVPLELILQILVGSGLVFRIREEPEDRYQLVHDYLVDPIRQHYQQRLHMDIETQLTQTKGELLKVRRQRWQALTIGTTMTILAFAAGVFGWRASEQTKLARRLSTNAELVAMSNSAKALLADDKPFDALLEALRAAKKMSEKNPQSLHASMVEPDTQLQVVTTLEQAVYGIHERTRLEGHTDSIWDVSFSPDSQIIASASKDNTVKLWQPDGSLLATLVGHQDSVTSIAFHPNSQTLASSSRDGTVRLWQSDGQPLNQFSAHNGYVYRVKFSSDGQYLVSSGGDGTVKIWTIAGQLVQTLRSNGSRVLYADFSPDAQLVAAAMEDKTVNLWDWQSGRLLKSLHSHTDQINYLAFNPKGDWLATASDDETVKLWQLDPGSQADYQLQRTLRGSDGFMSVKFSPDGKLIAAGGHNNEIRIWQHDGKLHLRLQGHSDAVSGISFHHNGITLASSSRDKTVKLWDLRGTSRTILRGHTDRVTDVAFSPDGNFLASASRDQTVKLWTSDGKLRQTFAGHTGYVERVAFSPDGELIASASRDQTVKIWRTDGQLLKTLGRHQDRVIDVTWSQDGQRLASASRDHRIYIWSRTGEWQETLRGHTDRVNSVAFSFDGKILASASDDKTVKLWYADEQGSFLSRLPRTLPGHRNWVIDVSFTPDGERIASGSYDNTVIFWSLSGELLQVLKGNTDSVDRLSFAPISPEGEFLATVNWDNQLKLWRDDDTLLQSLKGHQERITSVSWRSDGKAIATGSDDMSVIIWNLNADELMTLSCDWLAGYFQNASQLRKGDLHLCH